MSNTLARNITQRIPPTHPPTLTMMMMMTTQRRYQSPRRILAARSTVLQLVAVLATALLLQRHAVTAVRNIQVAVPLQSLTIWDPEVVVVPSPSLTTLPSDTSTTAITSAVPPFSFRANFLSKFQKGLQAEVKARNTLQQQQQQDIASISNDSGPSLVNSKKKAQKQQQQHWATQAARNDQRQHEIREAIVERAYDEAIQQHEQEQEKVKSRPNRKNPNRYQFVGVINNHPNPEKHRNHEPITWYTRVKPKHAKWTIRLIHVNRAAILKDLYNQKKIDIFAHYQNESQDRKTTEGPTTMVPTVTGQYRVRERSWKNLWNMSLKHMLTDSSGMYWRERRIHSINPNDLTHQFLYTDGNHVYEATYRYMPDGRNGMHKVSTLAEFLNSRSIDSKMKQRIVQRLQNDTPDIVLEE